MVLITAIKDKQHSGSASAVKLTPNDQASSNINITIKQQRHINWTVKQCQLKNKQKTLASLKSFC